MDEIKASVKELTFPHCPKLNSSTYYCTPDNGLLYASNFSITYIPPVDEPNFSIKVFYSTKRIKSIACDPDWNETKYFAVTTLGNSLLIYDVRNSEPIQGIQCFNKHKDSDKDNEASGAICFTTNKKIYIIDTHVFIVYCVLSNTYVNETPLFNLYTNCASVIKSSPLKPNLYAVGTKKGLILVCDLISKKILYRLRGHDSEIVALDFIYTKKENYEKQSIRSIDEIKEPKRETMIKDSDNIFDDDIYSFDDLENEFGTIRDTKPLEIQENFKFQTSSENFDFVDACEMLKEDIKLANEIEVVGNLDNIPTTADEVRRMYRLTPSKKNVSDSTTSLCPSTDSRSIRDFNESIPENEKLNEQELQTFLASGARESTIWIWDFDEGTALDKIKLKRSKTLPYSTTFTNVCWIDDKTLIIKNPNGDISEWMIENLSSKQNIKIKLKNTDFSSKSLLGLCTNQRIISNKIIMWSFSLHKEITCTQLDENIIDIAHFSTIIPNTAMISECPIDLNKIAVACSQRVVVTNLSSLTPTSIKAQNFCKNIQSRVHCVSWHPTKENILAFGTYEGQIGIYDTSKPNNTPVRIKPFCNKSIYSITWGNLQDNIVLYVCANGKLVYFPECGNKKLELHSVDWIQNVSEVTHNGNTLVVGTNDGILYITDSSNNLKISEKISLFQDNIYSIHINPINKNLIAVSSKCGKIVIIDKTKCDERKILLGHKSSVACVRWSYNSLNKLVSASFDHTVRIWDTNTLEIISCCHFNGAMYSVIFCPMDDNFIICNGHRTTLEIIDYKQKNQSGLEINEVTEEFNNIIWGKKDEIIDQKKKKHLNKESITEKTDLPEEIIENIKSMNIEEKTIPNQPLKSILNTSPYYLCSKEMNRDVIPTLQKLLDEDLSEEEKSNVFHKKIFSSDRSKIYQLLQDELNNIKISSTNSPGQIMFPSMMNTLKDEIMEKIEKKTLSEHYIALAPYISFEFWKITCKAYAYQCIEKGLSLHAIPYLIVCHEIKDSIESLCNSNYFREAFIMCKIYKEPEDPIQKEVLDKWLKHLEYCGNYLALVLIYLCNDNYKDALRNLEKIKNPISEIEKIIDIIKTKV